MRRLTGQPGKSQAFGAFQMLRDVLVASINKGQFPVAMFGMVVLALICKMPSAEVSVAVFRVLDAAEKRWGIGYALALCLAIGWFFHARYLRRVAREELMRVTGVRTSLQKRVLGERISSSEES